MADDDQDQRNEDDTSEESDEEIDETEAGGETAEDDAEEDGDADDEETEFLAALTPEQAKYYAMQQTQLQKARADARRHRKARRAVEAGAGVKPTTGTGPKPGPRRTTADAPLSKTELMAELRAEMQAEATQTRVLSLAERALESAGLVLPSDPDQRERKLGRVIKMLDLSTAKTREDVADEIADLKDDNPELFRRKRAKPKTGGVGGPSRVRGGGKAPDRIAGLFEE